MSYASFHSPLHFTQNMPAMSEDKALIERMTAAVKKSHQALKVVQDQNKNLKQENEELRRKISSLEAQLRRQKDSIATVIEPPSELKQFNSHDECKISIKAPSVSASCIDPPNLFDDAESNGEEDSKIRGPTNLISAQNASSRESIDAIKEHEVKRRRVDNDNKPITITPVAGSWIPTTISTYATNARKSEGLSTKSAIKLPVSSKKHLPKPAVNQISQVTSVNSMAPRPMNSIVNKVSKVHGNQVLQTDLLAVPSKQRATKLVQDLNLSNYRNVARALSSLPMHLTVKTLLHHMHVAISKPVLREYSEAIVGSATSIPALPSAYKASTITPIVKMLLSMCAEKELGVGYGSGLVKELIYRLVGRCRRRLRHPIRMLLEGVDKALCEENIWESWRDTLRIPVREENSEESESVEVKMAAENQSPIIVADSVETSNSASAMDSVVLNSEEAQRKTRDELAWMLDLSDDDENETREEKEEEEEEGGDECSRDGSFDPGHGEDRGDMSHDFTSRYLGIENEVIVERQDLDMTDGDQMEVDGGETGMDMSAGESYSAYAVEDAEVESASLDEHNSPLSEQVDEDEDQDNLSLHESNNLEENASNLLSIEMALLHQQLSDHALAYVIISTLRELGSGNMWEEFSMAILHHTHLGLGMGIVHALLLHHSSSPLDFPHVDLICSVALIEMQACLSAYKNSKHADALTYPKYVNCLHDHIACQRSLLQQAMNEMNIQVLTDDNLGWFNYGLLTSLLRNVDSLSDLGLGGVGGLVKHSVGMLQSYHINTLSDQVTKDNCTCKSLVEIDLFDTTDILDRLKVAAKEDGFVDVHKFSGHFATYFHDKYNKADDKLGYWQSMCKSIQAIDHSILAHWRHSLDEEHTGVRAGSSMEGVHLTILAKTKMGVIKDTIGRLHSIEEYSCHQDAMLSNLMQLYENIYVSMHGTFAHRQHAHLYKVTPDTENADICKMLFTEHCTISVQEIIFMADILDHIRTNYLVPYKSVPNQYSSQHAVHVAINKLMGHVHAVAQYIVLFMIERFTTMYFHSMAGLLQHVRSALLTHDGSDKSGIIDVLICVVLSLHEHLPNPWGISIHGVLQTQVVQTFLNVYSITEDFQSRRYCQHWLAHLMKVQAHYAPVALVINLGRRADRWRSMLREASSWKFIAYRIPAVDAKALKEIEKTISVEDVSLEWNCSLNALFDKRYEKYNQAGVDSIIAMTPSERGCAMSHLVVWKALYLLNNPQACSIHSSGTFGEQIQQIASDLEYFHASIANLLQGFYFVCEDDMQVSIKQIVTKETQSINNMISHYHHTMLTELFYVIRKAPADADLIYLGGVVPKCNKVVKKLFRHIFVKVNYIWQLHGYLIHRNAIPKLLQELPISMPVDNFLAALAYEGKLNIYTLLDTIVIQKGGAMLRRAADTDIIHSV